MSLGSKKLSRIETLALANLLMGAAYADDQLESVEKKIVLKILNEVTKEPMLPIWLMTHVEKFSPSALDIEKSCRELRINGGEEATMLLSLLVRVTEADDVHDFDEGSYLVRVAKAVNAPKESYENLSLDLVEDLEIEEIEIEL